MKIINYKNGISGPDGEINDYLEQRRPFLAPNQGLNTHWDNFD